MIKHSSRTDLNVQPLSLEQRWIQAPSPLNTPIRSKTRCRWRARLGVAGLLVATSSAAGGSGSDSLHSLDRSSTSALGGVEGYEDSIGPAVKPVITKQQLDLPNAAAIDALSTGRENGVAAIIAGTGHYPGMGGPHIRYQFSADRIAVDDFEGSVIDSLGTPLEIHHTDEFQDQFALNDQAADILDNVGTVVAGVVNRINFLQVDEEKLELDGGSAMPDVLSADDIDGFTSAGAMGGTPDADSDGVLDRAVYFSVDGLSGGMHPAHIYVKLPGEALSIYASFQELGLDFFDDLDALSIWDATENGVFDEGDGVVFSLRRASASLPITVGAATITEGGVVFATPAGGFEDALPAGFFALQDSDELDAVHVVDPRDVRLPCDGLGLISRPIRALEALVATPSTLEIQFEGACTGERHIGVVLNQTLRAAGQSNVIKEFHVFATSNDPSVVVFTGASPMGWSGPGPNDSYGCSSGGMGGPGGPCALDRAFFGALNLDAYDDVDDLLQGVNRCIGSLTVATVGVGSATIEIICVALNENGVQLEMITDTVQVVVTESSGQIFGTCDLGTNVPCGNTSDACSGCLNSTGAGARLIAIDMNGLAASTADQQEGNAFQVRVSNLPPSAPILLFTGMNQINGGLGVPFGNGLRCVGGSIKRLGVRFAGADGSASWVRIPPIEVWGSSPLAGDTRAFQGWYRDISGGGCASLFNLTNGYAVTYSG